MTVAQLTPREFDKFRGFIYAQSGIHIGDRKVALLSNRIRRRLQACGFEDFAAYYRYLTSPQATHELDFFLDAITTNETFFFRTPKHFAWFNDEFLPDIVASYQRGDREASLRVWSAACANGAEPYSIAIYLAENRFRLKDWTLTVLGTDLSEQQLEQAREGVFKSRNLKDVTSQQLRRYFQPLEGDRWQLRDKIKDTVEFSQHNLMLPPPRTRFDCVFLCNVLIYFDEESKQQVLKNAIQSLARGGYLVLGPSEGAFEYLDPLEKRSSCIYQK